MSFNRVLYATVIVVIACFLSSAANQSYAADLLSLDKDVQELRRQIKALQQDVNSLKARLDKMSMQPRARSQAVTAKAPQAAAPLSEAEMQAAKKEVCSALEEYEKKIKHYVKMRNPDDMWEKMKKAYFALEKVLNKYEQFKVIQKIDQLTGDVISDIYQGRLARDSIPGNADFRKAVDRHVKKLREIQKACN